MDVTMGGDSNSHAGTISAVAWEGGNIGRNTIDMDLLTVAHAVGNVNMRNEGDTGIRQAAIFLCRTSEDRVQLGYAARVIAKPVLRLGRVELGKVVSRTKEAGRKRATRGRQP